MQLEFHFNGITTIHMSDWNSLQWVYYRFKFILKRIVNLACIGQVFQGALSLRLHILCVLVFSILTTDENTMVNFMSTTG